MQLSCLGACIWMSYNVNKFIRKKCSKQIHNMKVLIQNPFMSFFWGLLLSLLENGICKVMIAGHHESHIVVFVLFFSFASYNWLDSVKVLIKLIWLHCHNTCMCKVKYTQPNETNSKKVSQPQNHHKKKNSNKLCSLFPLCSVIKSEREQSITPTYELLHGQLNGPKWLSHLKCSVCWYVELLSLHGFLLSVCGSFCKMCWV